MVEPILQHIFTNLKCNKVGKESERSRRRLLRSNQIKQLTGLVVLGLLNNSKIVPHLHLLEKRTLLQRKKKGTRLKNDHEYSSFNYFYAEISIYLYHHSYYNKYLILNTWMSTIFYHEEKEYSNKMIKFVILLSEFKLESAQNLLNDLSKKNYYNHL